MKSLHSFIQSFTENERSVIRYSLKAFKDSENKYVKLFEYFCSCQTLPTRAETSRSIYKAKPDNRITKLVSRLKDKINYIIIGENFMEKTERLIETDKTRIRIKRNSAVINELTHLYGQNRPYTQHLIEENIKDAIKLKMYVDAVHMLRLKRSYFMFKVDLKKCDDLSEQIHFYMKCYEMDEKVQSYFYEIQNKYIFPGKDNYDKKLLRMKNILDEINENVAYVQSDYTIYMHDFLKASYWEMKENYVQVKKVLMNLSRFIKSSPLPHIYKHRNINSIGECEIYLGNYQKAIQQFKKAKPFYSLTHKANYYYTLNYEFYPRFYLSQINESEKIVDELLQNAFPLHSEFHMGRYQYFKACIHYEKKEYKQALGILNSSLLLSKDKTGYDILIRVMRIKCLLETECYDQASDQVEVLRRHASRYKNKNYLSERNVIIIKILLLMDKRGFNGIPLSEEKELIKKITETSGLHAWKPLSPELIKFHEWYENFMQFR